MCKSAAAAAAAAAAGVAAAAASFDVRSDLGASEAPRGQVVVVVSTRKEQIVRERLKNEIRNKAVRAARNFEQRELNKEIRAAKKKIKVLKARIAETGMLVTAARADLLSSGEPQENA
jgi:hypothetical protein